MNIQKQTKKQQKKSGVTINVSFGDLDDAENFAETYSNVFSSKKVSGKNVIAHFPLNNFEDVKQMIEDFNEVYGVKNFSLNIKLQEKNKKFFHQNIIY